MMVCSSVIVISLCLSYCTSNKLINKIALGVQGKTVELKRWMNVVEQMKNHTNLTLFFLTFDAELESRLCKKHDNFEVVCLFDQGTWTAGRNLLAREIILFEKKRNQDFKYWLMADEDQSLLPECNHVSLCHQTHENGSNGMISCCFDSLIEQLLQPNIQYAIVNYAIVLPQVAWKQICLDQQYFTFVHYDCADPALVAYHHAVTPIVFPMIELLDKLSWWESQALQFPLIASCIPLYSVYSNLMCRKLSGKRESTDHSVPYPRGRNKDDETKALNQVYGTRGIIPTPILETAPTMRQGNCVNHDSKALGLLHLTEPRNSNFNSSFWQTLPSFLTCKGAMLPRFNEFMKTGNLSAIDGVVYPKKSYS